MNFNTRDALRVCALAATLFATSIVCAQSTYSIGATLTEAQVNSMGELQTFTVGNATFRMLPVSNNAEGGNVINRRGKVGRCNPEVLISGIPIEQAQHALSPYQSLIVSTKVYDTLKMVSARFANIPAAARARNEIATSLPGATVTLPILFSIPQVN